MLFETATSKCKGVGIVEVDEIETLDSGIVHATVNYGKKGETHYVKFPNGELGIVTVRVPGC